MMYSENSDSEHVRIIYYDKEYKRDQLEGTLKGYKKKFGSALFPNLSNENILDYYFELVSPEHLSQTFFISNVNLNKEKSTPYIFLRPKIDGPRLETAFPHGLCVAFKGTLFEERTGGFSMTVFALVVISQSNRKEFELEAEAELVQKKIPQFRKNNLLTPEYVEMLQNNPIESRKLDIVDFYQDCIHQFLILEKIEITECPLLADALDRFISNLQEKLNATTDPLPKEVEYFRSLYKEKKGVVINTCMGIKGEEFDTVISCGLLRGYVPHWEEICAGNELDSSKKLLYVICSRARLNLYLISETGRQQRNGTPLEPTRELFRCEFQYDV